MNVHTHSYINAGVQQYELICCFPVRDTHHTHTHTQAYTHTHVDIVHVERRGLDLPPSRRERHKHPDIHPVSVVRCCSSSSCLPPAPSDSSLLSRLDDLQRSFSFPRAAMTVQLCTASAGLQYGPEERDFLSAAQPVPRERGSDTRFLVFRDLRQRGFCLTSAGKFGGDFLVYPGGSCLRVWVVFTRVRGSV